MPQVLLLLVEKIVSFTAVSNINQTLSYMYATCLSPKVSGFQPLAYVIT